MSKIEAGVDCELIINCQNEAICNRCAHEVQIEINAEPDESLLELSLLLDCHYRECFDTQIQTP